MTSPNLEEIIRVNNGTTANDGTGDNLRAAFDVTNNNVAILKNFLLGEGVVPTFGNLIIPGELTATSLVANTSIFTSNASFQQDVFVDGTLHSDIVSQTLVAGVITSTGDAHIIGNLITGGTTSLSGNLAVGNNVEINGSLTVHGNSILVTTSEFIIEHPTIELGRVANASLSTDDGKDRGAEFYWFDTQENKGFFGFQDATGKFTFIPKSTYTGPGDLDVFQGNVGSAIFDEVEANIVSIGSSTFNIINSEEITATGITGTLLTNAQPNITSVSTLDSLDVTGNVSIDGNVSIPYGDVYLNSGTVRIWSGGQWVPVALSNQSFNGGPVSGKTNFTFNGLASDSVGYDSGAVVITNGLGIGGNLNVGGKTIGNIVVPSFTNVQDFTANTITGPIITPAQPYITSLGILDSLTVQNDFTNLTGNITTNNIGVTGRITTTSLTVNSGISGTLLTADQPNITSVGNLTTLTVVGSITANNFVGNMSGTVSGNISGSASTVTFADQPAITSLGTLTSLNVSGNIICSNINAGSGTITTTGNISSLSSVIGSYLYGQVNTSAQPSITQLGTLSALTVSGTSTFNGNAIIGASLLATGSGTQTIGTATNRFGTIYADGSQITNIYLPDVGFLASNAFVRITTDAKGRVSSTFPISGNDITDLVGALPVGNSAFANVAGNIQNQRNSATIASSSSSIPNEIVLRDSSGSFGANVINAISINSSFNGSGAGLTSIPNSALVNSSVSIFAGNGISGGGTVSLGGNVTLTNTGVTQIVSGWGITVSSNTGIVTINTNGTALSTPLTLVNRDSNGNFSANVITATSTSAQYADLAEKYQSDGQYDSGTVLVFGGSREVTVTGHFADVSVAGVVSTAPAYLMNQDEKHSVAVALRGKVPVKVMGPVRKGDLLVTSYVSGFAESVGKDTKFGVAVFAKSLQEDLEVGAKLINAVII